MGTVTELIARLDSDDQRKGKQFEHICKWFLTNDPVYRQQLRRCVAVEGVARSMGR